MLKVNKNNKNNTLKSKLPVSRSLSSDALIVLSNMVEPRQACIGVYGQGARRLFDVTVLCTSWMTLGFHCFCNRVGRFLEMRVMSEDNEMLW